MKPFKSFTTLLLPCGFLPLDEGYHDGEGCPIMAAGRTIELGPYPRTRYRTKPLSPSLLLLVGRAKWGGGTPLAVRTRRECWLGS